MTHVELIEAIKEDYKKEFANDKTEDKEVEAFRKGVIFAFNYLVNVLKNGDTWIYEKKGE